MEQRIDTKKLLLYAAGTLALSLILIAVRVVLLLSYFDPNIQQYALNTSSPLYFHAALCVAAAILLTSYFAFRKKSVSVNFSAPTQTTVFAASLCAFMLIAYIILEIYEQFSTNFSFILYFQNFAKYEQKCRELIFKGALVLLAVPSSVYFFRVASSSGKNKKSLGFLSFCPILWIMILLISTYFDLSVAYNNPNRILNQMALIGSMLYFVGESRYQLHIEKPHLYIPLALLSVLLLSVSTIPTVILNSFWVLNDTFPTVCYAVQLALCVYIASRIGAFFRKPIEQEESFGEYVSAEQTNNEEEAAS